MSEMEFNIPVQSKDTELLLTAAKKDRHFYKKAFKQPKKNRWKNMLLKRVVFFSVFLSFSLFCCCVRWPPFTIHGFVAVCQIRWPLNCCITKVRQQGKKTIHKWTEYTTITLTVDYWLNFLKWKLTMAANSGARAHNTKRRLISFEKCEKKAKFKWKSKWKWKIIGVCVCILFVCWSYETTFGISYAFQITPQKLIATTTLAPWIQSTFKNCNQSATFCIKI